MVDYFISNMWQFWTLVFFVCLILELTSGDFFIMCFSLGAIVPAIVAACGGSITLQVILFAVCSALCIFFVRPLALKYFHKSDEERLSNADALIGKTGRVVDTIYAEGHGRVAIDGDNWRAKSATGEAIAKDTLVKVVDMESIIVTVEPVTKE